MRALLTSMALAFAVLACAKSLPPRNARSSAGETQAKAAGTPTPPPSTTGTVSTEPAPDSWKRYFVDQGRFSAMFPALPTATEMGRDVAYVALNPAGATFMVVCGPSGDDHGRIRRAHASVASSGHIISEGYPYFFGTEGYMAHVRLPDESEKATLFVDYGGRYCRVTAEVRSADETAMQLIESFRPEPEGR